MSRTLTCAYWGCSEPLPCKFHEAQPGAVTCEKREPIRFVCPECGVSFSVSSERSERIYCGRCIRAHNRAVA